MKRSTLGKEKFKNVHFEEKRNTRKCNGAKSSAQGLKKFEEKPDAKWKTESSDLRTRLYPSKCPTCENKLKTSLNTKGISNRKLMKM